MMAGFSLYTYNQFRSEIEAPFLGLPHAHTTLIKTLIQYADPLSGIVSDISYEKISKMLYVHAAPGRSDSGSPSKSMIRSYIKTIERHCPESFASNTERNHLQLIFLKMPTVYQNILNINELNTDLNQKNCNYFNDIDGISNNPSTDLNTPDIYKTKITKQTKTEITADFYPSQETIAIAKARGLTKVEDLSEIQKFIEYNLEQQTRWADFNPVFLRWLEREVEYRERQESKEISLVKQQKTISQTNIKPTWRNMDERAINTKNMSIQQLLSRVKQHHENRFKDTAYALYGSDESEKSQSDAEGYFIPVVTADRNIRDIVY